MWRVSHKGFCLEETSCEGISYEEIYFDEISFKEISLEETIDCWLQYRVYLKFSDTWNELFVVNWFISNFFWGNTKWKKVSSPHYLKILMKWSKHGISYSLKRDLSSISKITFYTNLRVSHIGTKLWYLLFKSAMPWPEWGQLNGFAEHFFFNFASYLKKLKLNINWANDQMWFYW